MGKIEIKDQEFELEDRDVALIMAIQELTAELKREANR